MPRKDQLFKVPMNMYRIKTKDQRIRVVCEHCHKAGYVRPTCNACGGNGARNKTIHHWTVVEDTVCFIDRDEDGDLRYWTDLSNYFPESRRLIHFTYDDAKKEATKRNEQENGNLYEISKLSKQPTLLIEVSFNEE